MKREYLLGVPVDCLTIEEAIAQIQAFLSDGKQHIVTTVNPEFIVDAQKDSSFKEILQKADLALPDGIGIQLAVGAPERLAGVDFLEYLFSHIARDSHSTSGNRGGVRTFFVGGRNGVADKAGRVLESRYPNVTVVGTYEGEADESHDRVTRDIIRNHSKVKSVDLLLVAYGHGKQEKWIARNLAHLQVKVAIGVGGAFDYLSGRVPRAPRVVRVLGMEWFFRLVVQPWRIKRQWKLVYFLWLVALHAILERAKRAIGSRADESE